MSGCKSIKFLVFISSIKYQVSNTSVNLSDLKFNYQVLNFFNIYIYSFLRVTFMRSYRADCIVYIYAIFAILLTSYSINFIVMFLQHA